MEDNSNKNEDIATNKNLKDDLNLTTQYIIEHIPQTLIFFCNPISGNQEGKIILNTTKNYKTKDGYKLIDFKYLESKNKNKYESIKVIIFELASKEETAQGEFLVKQCYEKCKQNKEKGLSEEYNKIRVLIGGGDGTILSTIENIIKSGTDINYCLFGHVPLGTGNDLANTLGFSDHVDISENNLDDLYKIFIKYYKAKIGKIDIWKMDLTLDENEGKVLVNTKNGKTPIKDENGNIIRRYVRTFINYISFGYDARVGYNFDPKRTTSRNKNKCIYFCEGFKKLTCRKTITIQNFIDTFTVYDNLNNSINQESFFSGIDSSEPKSNNEINIVDKPHKIKFKFVSKQIYEKKKKNKLDIDNNKYLVIDGDPCTIIFQNIVNYMSGVKDMWGKGKNQLAVDIKSNKKEDKEKYLTKLKTMINETQKFNDKQLEIFTFDNGFKTGFEKVIGGFARKIYHGRGPMELKFLETPDYVENDKKNRIYMNLDGEYFHIVKPVLLRVELNRDMCQGQLPFLIGDI